MNKPHLEGCPNIDCHNNKDCCPFRKIVIPSVMGGDSEGEDYAPENGAYRNALVEYESNGHIYMYSSDGIPTRMTGESGASDYEVLTNKPSINGHELIGNKTAEELGITSPEPLYVYCLDTYDGQEPGNGVYTYKDASRTVPMTVGEILEAYGNGNRVVFVSAPPDPRPDTYANYVYNELVHVSVTYSHGTSHPATGAMFYAMNNRAGSNAAGSIWQVCWKATSPSDTWMSATRTLAQNQLTAGEGITISGNVISATGGGGGGGATMFYADLQSVHSNLEIYADSSQSEIVDSAAMIAALSRGPVMIKDTNDRNIYVTVVSANGSSGPVSIVIAMYDDQGEPATRRFEFEGPDWVETLLN